MTTVGTTGSGANAGANGDSIQETGVGQGVGVGHGVKVGLGGGGRVGARFRGTNVAVAVGKGEKVEIGGDSAKTLVWLDRVTAAALPLTVRLARPRLVRISLVWCLIVDGFCRDLF